MLTLTRRNTTLDPDPATRRDPRTCESAEPEDQTPSGRPEAADTIEERKTKARIYARQRRADLRASKEATSTQDAQQQQHPSTV
jgi:hypothetical protein